jgi:hypothetical protein
MARRVFFSFHYDRDVRRIQQVRNSWVVRQRGESPPFYDAADFEEAKRRAGGIQKWIDGQLRGCSVTAVLFGRETFARPWVNYELEESHRRGMGILAIDIHNVKDPLSGAESAGPNPLEYLSAGDRRYSMMYRSYDWVRDDGYNNIAIWIERAAAAAGR